MTIEQLEAYELIEKKVIDELKSTGYYLKHRKTGAKGWHRPQWVGLSHITH